MAGLLQIRDVPDATRRELKARAARNGQSLNSYLVDLLNRDVASPTAADVFRRAERRAERASASALDAVTAARAEQADRIASRTTA